MERRVSVLGPKSFGPKKREENSRRELSPDVWILLIQQKPKQAGPRSVVFQKGLRFGAQVKCLSYPLANERMSIYQKLRTSAFDTDPARCVTILMHSTHDECIKQTS